MTRHEDLQLKLESHQQVQTFLEEIIQRSNLPGISVAINVNGDTLEATAGLSDTDINKSMIPGMYFKLGCLNKFLIAVVVLELFDKGFIDIEKAISYYLPELCGKNGDTIKVWHLLSHTAGYQGENLTDPDIVQDYTWEKFACTFNQRQILFEPGTVFDYSHSAAVILGKIIEVVTQRKAQLIIRELIMEPLGIRAINKGNTGSANCISEHIFIPESAQFQKFLPTEWCEFWSTSLDSPWITMLDLAIIGRLMVEDSSIISSTTKNYLLSQVVNLPGRFVGKIAEQPYFAFGFGCGRFSNGSYGVRSSSTGQCCALRFDREKKLVIAVGINTNAACIRDFIIEKLLNALLSENTPVIPDFNPSPQNNLPVKELIGTYQGPAHHNIDVYLKNDQLVMRLGHNPAITHDTTQIVLKWVKDNHGNIVPSHNSILIPIGFFRDTGSKRLGLMVGDNAYMKKDECSMATNAQSTVVCPR